MDTDGISSIRELVAEANPDVILGADIVRFLFRSLFTNCELIVRNQVYDPSIIPPLIATIHLVMSATGSTGRPPVSAVLALTVRKLETFRCFLDAAGKPVCPPAFDTPLIPVQRKCLLSPASSLRWSRWAKGKGVDTQCRRSS